MTVVVRRSAIAAERLPHGSLVRFEGTHCCLAPDLEHGEGVTCRPASARGTCHEAGEALTVQTDGPILAEISGEPRWVELRRGRILCPEPVR